MGAPDRSARADWTSASGGGADLAWTRAGQTADAAVRAAGEAGPGARDAGLGAGARRGRRTRPPGRRRRGTLSAAGYGGGDVLAVPDAPYADTSGDGRVMYYAVAAVADSESAGPLSGRSRRHRCRAEPQR